MPTQVSVRWSTRWTPRTSSSATRSTTDVLDKDPRRRRASPQSGAAEKPVEALPTLLEFTIYDVAELREGVRGPRLCRRGGLHPRNRGPVHSVVPYQHDGDDARAVIGWIAKQAWSDGRVGMYGDGYSGFTPWAAAKHMPPALKAIATSGPSAPGIDVPMGGGIFHNSAYRWSSYVTNSEGVGSRQLLRRRAVARARSEVVHQRKALSRPGIFVREAQSDIHPLAESSQLRSILAGDDSLQGPVCPRQYSRADDHRLLRRQRDRRLVLLQPAPSVQRARRPYAGDRSV